MTGTVSPVDGGHLVSTLWRQTNGDPMSRCCTRAATRRSTRLSTAGGSRQKLDATFPTPSLAVKVLEAIGILSEMTGQKTNRVYSYQAYVELL